jgi:hypothetical protein
MPRVLGVDLGKNNLSAVAEAFTKPDGTEGVVLSVLRRACYNKKANFALGKAMMLKFERNPALMRARAACALVSCKSGDAGGYAAWLRVQYKHEEALWAFALHRGRLRERERSRRMREQAWERHFYNAIVGLREDGSRIAGVPRDDRGRPLAPLLCIGDGYKGHIRQAEAGATRAMRAFNASSLCGDVKGVVLLRVNEHRTTMTHHRCGCVNDKVFDHRPGHNLRNKAEARLHGRHYSSHFAVRGLLHCPQCCSFVDRDVNGALNIARAGEAEWLYGPSARPAHLQRQARKPGDRPPAVPGTWVLRSSRIGASGHPD